MLFDNLDDYQADPEAYGARDLEHALESAERYGQCGAETPLQLDFAAGRCADCTNHRGASECRGCEYQASADVYAPELIGSADLSYLPRLEAERLTAEWKTKSARHPSDLSEAPLFGGKKQGEMFS